MVSSESLRPSSQTSTPAGASPRLVGVLDRVGHVVEVARTDGSDALADLGLAAGQPLWEAAAWGTAGARDQILAAVTHAIHGRLARDELELAVGALGARLRFAVIPMFEEDGRVSHLVFEGFPADPPEPSAEAVD